MPAGFLTKCSLPEILIMSFQCKMVHAKAADLSDGQSSASHLNSLLFEPLSVPASGIGNDLACVALNPNLDGFQTRLAQEVFLLLRLRVKLNEMVYEILGCLSPSDVLKKSYAISNSVADETHEQSRATDASLVSG